MLHLPPAEDMRHTSDLETSQPGTKAHEILSARIHINVFLSQVTEQCVLDQLVKC